MTLLFDTRCWTLFTATVLSAAYWPVLPTWPWALLLVATIIFILKFRRFRGGLGIFLALGVVIIHGNLLYWQAESLFRAGVHSTINARVDSPFIRITHGYEGIITIYRLNDGPIFGYLPIKVRAISTKPYQIGDKLYAHVTISPNYGLRNRVGFDRERYMFSRGLMAKVTIDASAPQRVVSVVSWRQVLLDRVEHNALQLTHYPLIKALVFGMRDELSPLLWSQLQGSGLLHLLSISGLHIGMAFGFGATIGLLLRRLSPYWLTAPLWFGLVASCGYAWLADFSIPTLRALLLCAIAVGLSLMRIHFTRWQLLLWTMSLNLCLTPFAPLSSSFWLSYGAVTAVMLSLPVTFAANWRARCKQLLLTQIKLTLLLIPLSLLFFHGISALSLMFNLVFIPWFSVLVIPALFVALLITIAAPMWASFAWTQIDRLLSPLAWAVSQAEIGWVALNPHWLPTCLVLLLLLLAWSWLRVKGRVVMTTLALGLAWRADPDPNLRVEVFDVGHGLAVGIIQNGHAVLYDTGSAWASGSMANMVVSPNLKSSGVTQLDGLILSHGDNDHAGGRAEVVREWSPAWIRSGRTQADLPCRQGERWRWQQTQWEVLWPPRLVSRPYNPHSCVIRVVDLVSGHKLLLTGDITAVAEWMLVRQPMLLNADVVIVPHHGSVTSSLAKFVEQVDAQIAIASIAKGNQWGLPRAEVIQRYTDQGSRWLDTGTDGQISLHFQASGVVVTTQRRETFEPWYRQMMRNQVE